MGRCRFFRRKRLQFEPANELNFIPVEPENVDMFLFAPVMAGLWEQHELWDGTYTLDDLMDIQEMMLVRSENERRAREAAAP